MLEKVEIYKEVMVTNENRDKLEFSDMHLNGIREWRMFDQKMSSADYKLPYNVKENLL